MIMVLITYRDVMLIVTFEWIPANSDVLALAISSTFVGSDVLLHVLLIILLLYLRLAKNYIRTCHILVAQYLLR